VAAGANYEISQSAPMARETKMPGSHFNSKKTGQSVFLGVYDHEHLVG
jgi:hypothetical protein